MTGKSPAGGYSLTSIISHWAGAIIVIVLFLSHDGALDSATSFHASAGVIVGIFLLWRVWHRASHGLTQKSNQFFLFNLAAQIVIWGFLVSIVLVVLSGYLLPWALGDPLDVFGVITIPSPFGPSSGYREMLLAVHAWSGQAFVPLLGLHILGAAKHAIIDRDGIVGRMFKPASGGK